MWQLPWVGRSTGAHFGVRQNTTSPPTYHPGSLGRAASPGMHPHATHSTAAIGFLPGASSETEIVLGELLLLSGNGRSASFFFFLAMGPGAV